MRRAPTLAEKRIWSWLRDRRFSGLKFRRQHPIGKYIVDFYCRELKLVIELDGQQHAGVLRDYDARRTSELESYGITVVRINNDLLIRDPRLVADSILFAVEVARTRSA